MHVSVGYRQQNAGLHPGSCPSQQRENATSRRNFAYDSGSGDGVGNPTTMRGNTYTFNSDNQITNSGFSYDGEGNPTTYGGTSLTFDVEDRMTAFGSAMSAGYDGFGRRAWKENTGGTTYYLYDGIMPVCELNSSGSLTAANTFGADGLLSRRVSSTSTFYTFDNQGGAAQRLDSGGGNVDTNQFDAFGNRIASTDSSTDPFSGYGAQWGYYTDSETGLELTGFRYYDSSVGRFINRDPIGYDGGLDLYAYVGNNPTDFIDPFGLDNSFNYILNNLWVLGPEFLTGPDDKAAINQFINQHMHGNQAMPPVVMAKCNRPTKLGTNQQENAKFKKIADDAGLSREQARRLHQDISKQEYTEQEIREMAEDMKKLSNDLKCDP